MAKPKRARTKFLVRYVLPSDSHGFLGRVFDLSIVALHFDSYEALAVYPGCKYVCDVNEALNRLVSRVESLNLVGNMLWPELLPQDFSTLPVSRHEWLSITADVFLMRYISVADCALLLVDEIFEFGLERRACTLANLRKKGLPLLADDILTDMIQAQGTLRFERNSRFHHGAERAFTRDDTTFRIAATFEQKRNRITGNDRLGLKINVQRMLKEGLVELQSDFNRSTQILVRQLDKLYDALWREFEARFEPRVHAATHGFNACRVR